MWKELFDGGGLQEVIVIRLSDDFSYSRPGFSAGDDYSLQVNLSMVEVSGRFLCSVSIPQCVVSLSSPDNIDNCMRSFPLTEFQKVPPNYCELKVMCMCSLVSHIVVLLSQVGCVFYDVCLTPSPSPLLFNPYFLPTATLLSTLSLNTTSAVEGNVPVSLSCIANTTGFHNNNISFIWAVEGGRPIRCSDNDNCSTRDIDGGVESVLTRTYDPGLISVSCMVLALDNTGTAGCVETTRRSVLTGTGERWPVEARIYFDVWGKGGGVFHTYMCMHMHGFLGALHDR